MLIQFGKRFLNAYSKHGFRRCQSTVLANSQSAAIQSDVGALEFKGDWSETERETLISNMLVLNNFITADEESKLMEEIEPYMKRLRYEFDHWDNAIHGFRETERNKWHQHNQQIFNRIANVAFDGQIMPFIHILDLHNDGYIKPHVDSVRFCGSTISGISLLSDSVMRLVEASEEDKTEVRNNNWKTPAECATLKYADILLRQRSLYIMKNTARYDYTHEILENKQSFFKGEKIEKSRRISVICRNEP